MKNKFWLIIIILVFAIIGAIIFFSNSFFGTDSKDIGYSVSKTGPSEEEINPTYMNNSVPNDNISDNNKSDDKKKASNKNNDKPKAEKKISSFSTKIYTFENNRQHNIGITIKTLNNTVVKKGDTFSFTSTVGQSSPSKGYRKADIFDRYRK